MVCPTKWTEGWIQPYLYPLVILKSKGVRVSSNPFYLGNLCVRLDEFVGNITLAVSTYCMLKQTDSNFIQVFSWESLRFIALKPMEFSAMVMEEVMLKDSSKKTKTLGTYKPQVQRWLSPGAEVVKRKATCQ